MNRMISSSVTVYFDTYPILVFQSVWEITWPSSSVDPHYTQCTLMLVGYRRKTCFCWIMEQAGTTSIRTQQWSCCMRCNIIITIIPPPLQTLFLTQRIISSYVKLVYFITKKNNTLQNGQNNVNIYEIRCAYYYYIIY